jgi:aryl-alcohol dehydrogenase-like predicted oxidoreductase
MQAAAPKMIYRYLGNSGLQVSVLSYGNWINSNTKETYELTRDAIKKCFDAGINFFDTAEVYGMGVAETVMGNAFKELNLPREELVVSTKIMQSSGDQLKVNDRFMSKKHIIEGLKNCLIRLQLDYVDVVYSHRPDYDTPLEETCRAFNICIEQGLAYYWGTSEWPADLIVRAIEICERENYHKPIVEQCQYNMLHRNRFEKEYRRLFSDYNYGTTIWSPLHGGLLSGKYNDGEKPEDSRFQVQTMFDGTWNKWFGPETKANTVTNFKKLAELATKLGFT